MFHVILTLLDLQTKSNNKMNIEKISNTTTVIVNMLAILGCLGVALVYILPLGKIDSNFSYYQYVIKTCWEDFVFLIFAVLFVFYSVKMYIRLSFQQSIVLFCITILLFFITLFLQQKNIYGYLVQKKRYYSFTLSKNYFSFLLDNAEKLEKSDRINESLASYKDLKRYFPNDTDSELINIRINLIENRLSISNSYYKKYEYYKANSKSINREGILCLIYSYYLNPESEIILKSINEEYKRILITIAEIEKNKGKIPANLCALMKKDNNLANIIFDEEILRVDFDPKKLKENECNPISYDLGLLRKSLYLTDLETILQKRQE